MPGRRQHTTESANVLLTAIGVLLVALCVFAVVRRQDAIAVGLGVLGLGAVVLAVLAPRLTGPVELGPTGFKLQLVHRLAVTGQAVGYSESDIVGAIGRLLAEGQTGDVGIEAPAGGRAFKASRDKRHSRWVSQADRPGIRWPDEADEAVQHARQAESLLRQARDSGGDSSNKDQAIQHAKEALKLADRESPSYGAILLVAAEAWLNEWAGTGSPQTADMVFAYATESLMVTPADEYVHSEALNLVADTIAGYGFVSGQDEAVEVLGRLEASRRSPEEPAESLMAEPRPYGRLPFHAIRWLRYLRPHLHR